MENRPVSVWKGTMNPAIMLGLALIIFTLILYFLDQTFNRGLGLISIVILIAGIVLGIRAFRDESRNGILTYGQAVGTGTVISLYSGILSAIFTYVLYSFIDPDLMEKMFTFMEEQYIEQGRLPESMIDQQMQLMRKIMTPITMPIFGVIGNVFYGVIISLIAAIFLKNEGDGFQQAMADVEE